MMRQTRRIQSIKHWSSPQARTHSVRSRVSRRAAFTLLELVATMLSATVLLAGLAATIAVAVLMLDVPETQSQDVHAQEIQDRMAMDLRYATTLTTPSSSSISLQRTSMITALPEQINYSFGNSGLSRQLNAGAAAQLDASPASYTASPDSYSVTTTIPKSVRWRSMSKVASSGSTNSLSIELPAGCVDGDLLVLCVSGRFASSGISNVSGTWSTIQDVSRAPMRQVVYYRFYTSASGSTPTSITSSSVVPLAATILAFSNTHASSPVSYSSTANGYSIGYFPPTHPGVLKPSTSNPSRMLVQFVSAEANQWPGGTFGLASYVDVAHALASPSSQSVSLGAAIRHGAYPGLVTTPKVFCVAWGNWVQTAVEIEVAP